MSPALPPEEILTKDILKKAAYFRRCYRQLRKGWPSLFGKRPATWPFLYMAIVDLHEKAGRPLDEDWILETFPEILDGIGAKEFADWRRRPLYRRLQQYMEHEPVWAAFRLVSQKISPEIEKEGRMSSRSVQRKFGLSAAQVKDFGRLFKSQKADHDVDEETGDFVG